jgi:hypothetical protein
MSERDGDLRPDRQFAVSGEWAIATDGIQWILQKRNKAVDRNGRPVWRSVSYVRSTKDVLARCMREKGTPPEHATTLLAAVGVRFSAPAEAEPTPARKTAPNTEAVAP